MIAVDTNSLIYFLSGRAMPATVLLAASLAKETVALPPPVVTELLSFPGVSENVPRIMRRLHVLPISDGFWERAADTRRLLLERRLRAKLADTLIAQCCIDADVPLLTADVDFRHFAVHCGLKLAM